MQNVFILTRLGETLRCTHGKHNAALEAKYKWKENQSRGSHETYDRQATTRESRS